MRAVGVLLLVVALVGCGGSAPPPAVAPADPAIVKAADGKAVVGNVEVRFEKILIGDHDHTILLRYKNLDKNRLWRYTGPEAAKLVDDVGNNYRYRGWSGEKKTLQPDEEYPSSASFEPPSKTAQHFKLSIAIDTLGGVGHAEFVYSRSEATIVK